MRSILTMALIAAFAIIGQAQCVNPTRQPPSKLYTSIRQVDFNNFVYRLRGEQITMRKGEETGRNPEGACPLYLVQTISYGDLTSDEKEEAVIVLGCSLAPGAGYSNAGYIYTLRQGQPVLLAEFEGGGRGDSIHGTIVASDGTLIVVKDDFSSDPPGFQAITYKWNGRKLVEAGRSAIPRGPDQ